jgi:hypothetical protein
MHSDIFDIDGARIRVDARRPGLVAIVEAYTYHYLDPSAARALAQALIEAAQRAEEDGAE